MCVNLVVGKNYMDKFCHKQPTIIKPGDLCFHTTVKWAVPSPGVEAHKRRVIPKQVWGCNVPLGGGGGDDMDVGALGVLPLEATRFQTETRLCVQWWELCLHGSPRMDQ